jgi:predicted nucleic acid-binding protein
VNLVVDASLSGAWFLPDEGAGLADRVLEQALAGVYSLCAPEIWVYEMLNLLVTAVRRGRMDESRMAPALAAFEALPVTRYGHTSLLSRRRVTSLATQFGLSAYDAAYLELADRLHCPLLTQDQALGEAASRLGLGSPSL